MSTGGRRLALGDQRHLVEALGHAGVSAGPATMRPRSTLDPEQAHLIVGTRRRLKRLNPLGWPDAAGRGQRRHLG